MRTNPYLFNVMLTLNSTQKLPKGNQLYDLQYGVDLMDTYQPYEDKENRTSGLRL